MVIFVRENNKIRVAYDEIYLYPEFNKLLTRYGKNDDTLDKILSYIYFTCDYKALPQEKGYNKKEAHNYAVKQAKLDISFEVNDDIKAAQSFYRNEQNDSIRDYMQNMVTGLRIGNKIAKVLTNKKSETFDEMSIEQLAAASGAVSELINISTKINTAIPLLLENIKKLKENEKEEAKSNKVLRGTTTEVPDSYLQQGELEDVDDLADD